MTEPFAEVAAYQPRREARLMPVSVRGLDLNVWCWEPVVAGTHPRHTLLAVHGWMDLGASFQFLVDHLPPDWRVFAPDWRGFGRSANTPGDSYWFYDYLGDLDGLVRQLLPDGPINLLGHSMGGNVSMMYAGVRPARIRTLINLEGAGMPPTRPARAPGRMAKWLDELIEGQRLFEYESLEAVAQRLSKNNPRLRADRALWLAGQWSEQTAMGKRRLLADPRHKQVNPYLYRADEIDAFWQAIAAPVLWVDSEHKNSWHGFTETDEYKARVARVQQLTHRVLAQTGHMLHHDQPEALAQLVQAFIEAGNA